ncbi:MAG: AAA family ATPase [Planctomycetes bacterium]|nr:AAA family ATPase [Planctomycetota bacterium]
MRTIAVINQKGGCGKTTVSINLAAVLASMGRKTLLVDMDPQSHCSLGLAVPESQVDRSIGDALLAGLSGTMVFSDVVWQVSRNLDLAPSTMALAGVEVELAAAHDKDRRLSQILSTVADHYDFCIIDCPPSIGLLTFNALRASDEVVIPVETGYFALQGAVRQEATIEMLARRANHKSRFKVLATMYDVRTKLAREILSELKRHFGDKLMPVVVNFNSKLKEAASFGQPITEYDPASRGMADFDKLATWLIANPPAPPEAPGDRNATTNPAISRAAELVERARALAARTAALSSKLSSDPDIVTERDIETARVAPAFGLPTVPVPPAPSRHTVMPEPVMAVGASPDSVGMKPPAPTPPGSALSHSEISPRPFAPIPPAARAPHHASNDSAVAVADAVEATTTLVPIAEPVRTAPVKPVATPALSQKLAKLYGAHQTSQGLLFVQPASKAASMHIAGDFNNWSAVATPLTRDDRLGVWQACINLPPGRYRYRLVVDGLWLHDPHNTYVEANPFGELNNVVEIHADPRP